MATREETIQTILDKINDIAAGGHNDHTVALLKALGEVYAVLVVAAF